MLIISPDLQASSSNHDVNSECNVSGVPKPILRHSNVHSGNQVYNRVQHEASSKRNDISHLKVYQRRSGKKRLLSEITESDQVECPAVKMCIKILHPHLGIWTRKNCCRLIVPTMLMKTCRIVTWRKIWRMISVQQCFWELQTDVLVEGWINYFHKEEITAKCQCPEWWWEHWELSSHITYGELIITGSDCIRHRCCRRCAPDDITYSWPSEVSPGRTITFTHGTRSDNCMWLIHIFTSSEHRWSVPDKFSDGTNHGS